jgi:hypothetical protein
VPTHPDPITGVPGDTYSARGAFHRHGSRGSFRCPRTPSCINRRLSENGVDRTFLAHRSPKLTFWILSQKQRTMKSTHLASRPHDQHEYVVIVSRVAHDEITGYSSTYVVRVTRQHE